MDALSAVLAVEEGPHGVRSNVIAPGPIGDTEGMDRLGTKNSSKQEYAKGIPLQRMGTKADIANAAVFLFSSAADFITGTVLVADGGSEHMRASQLPYPQSVLNPKAVVNMFRGKL